jgi:hypothetical protein
MNLPSHQQQTPSRGRPVGQVHASVAQVLASGVVAGVDALATQTGWPPESVRVALRSMLRGGRIGAVGSAERPARAARVGRPRAAYAWRPARHAAFGINGLELQQVCAAWRGVSDL